MADTGATTSPEQESLWSQIKDWVFDHGESILSWVLAVLAFLAVVTRANVDGVAVVLGIAVLGTTGTQVVVRHRAKERIDALKSKFKESTNREEQYAEELHKLHSGTKAALAAWLTTISPSSGLNSRHRVSLFVIGTDEKCAYLLARVSQNAEFHGVNKTTYTNDGAVRRAWQDGKYISCILPDRRNGAKKRDYVDAVVAEFSDVKRGRVEKSLMSPRLYAAWRLDVGSDPQPSVLVFESQLDDRDKCEILETRLTDQAGEAMRQLAA